ncbi:MAG: flavin reductase [Chloroflexi bacterium]|nr:flavin reductase [Chloroflexota bacterium]OJV99104.1 MAG: flavin reductase [Chloroflexi bacterium 54-19]
MDETAKKKILRHFTYGLYAITVAEGGSYNAFTANWLSQTSFEPPMVMLSVENDSHSLPIIRRTKVFVVNILASGQRELAGQLGRSYLRNPQKLEGVNYTLGAGGCPILEDALGWLECRVTAEVGAGDSTVFIAEIVEAGELREGVPLTMKEAGFRHSG